ncbi:MAG TPA: hypothetical protein VM937_07420 [Burkholderiaceae bacterium]|nr:hypothetical protein [Burkholderiaceae bacterium]
MAQSARLSKTSATALFLTLTLSACGGSDSPAAPAVGSPAPAPVPPPAPAPPAAASLACPPAAGRVLTVGSGKQYATIREAAAASQNGDTIHISAGDYRGDVATWNASNLTLCGVGGRAKLFADGVHEGGKGIWVVRGSNTTVHSVEFHGAKVPDQNGAGIRQEGPTLTVRDTGFYDNENGILSDNGTNSTITIEYSEFARNGFGDGQSHNIYIGQIGVLNVRYSFFHEAKVGHNLKTRARENNIENSYFADGTTGTSSYLLNFDNGGRALVRGNLLHKGPNADNSILITHYANIWGASFNSLTLEHNTLVSTYSGGSFININTGAAVTLTANIFAGTGNPSLIGGATATQSNNIVTTATQIPGASNVAAPNFWPSAALLPQLNLATSVVPGYSSDSPRPYAARAITGTSRMIGALQSSP